MQEISNPVKVAKAKAGDSYIVDLRGTKPDQPHFTIIGTDQQEPMVLQR